jgi:hypothetical protein
MNMSELPAESTEVGDEKDKQREQAIELLALFFAKDGLKAVRLAARELRLAGSINPHEFPNAPGRAHELQKVEAHVIAALRVLGYDDNSDRDTNSDQ